MDISRADLPRECVLLFGQEGPGLSAAARDACAAVLHIPQFGSTNPCPCNRQFTIGVSGTLSNSLVTEIFYGSSNRPITNYALNTANVTRSGTGLTGFPMIFPNAVQLDYVPSFVFSGSGSRVANAPTNNTQYAPFENNNASQDFVASLTKLHGEHTFKTGFFVNRAVKEQSSRAAANGLVSFANDASNPLDTGFPFANAAIGVYQSYSQAAGWIKGNFVYDNIEWYVQDNWRATNHLTLDYGMRFYWLQPTYDTRLQASNFLPDQFDPAKAPRLYYPGFNAAGTRVGIDTATGAIVPAVEPAGMIQDRIQTNAALPESWCPLRAPVRICLRCERRAAVCHSRRIWRLLRSCRGGHGLRHDRTATDAEPAELVLRTAAGHHGRRVRHSGAADDLRVRI